MLSGLSLSLAAGNALLIRGPSGSGKTTLLRAIAGLWPYCQGNIGYPLDSVLFLSQKPYLPLGSLRDALSYPQAAVADADRIQADLASGTAGPPDQPAGRRGRLEPHPVAGRATTPGVWPPAVGRTKVAFLDEATSAMDEGLEDALYRLVRSQLPETVLVSVGHRSTLLVHHSHQLQLEGEGRWLLQ